MLGNFSYSRTRGKHYEISLILLFLLQEPPDGRRRRGPVQDPHPPAAPGWRAPPSYSPLSAPFQRNDSTRASLGVGGGGGGGPNYGVPLPGLADQFGGLDLNQQQQQQQDPTYYNQVPATQEYPQQGYPDPATFNGYGDYPSVEYGGQQQQPQMPSPGKMYQQSNNGVAGGYAGYNGYSGNEPGYGYTRGGQQQQPGYSPGQNPQVFLN